MIIVAKLPALVVLHLASHSLRMRERGRSVLRNLVGRVGLSTTCRYCRVAASRLRRRRLSDHDASCCVSVLRHAALGHEHRALRRHRGPSHGHRDYYRAQQREQVAHAMSWSDALLRAALRQHWLRPARKASASSSSAAGRGERDGPTGGCWRRGSQAVSIDGAGRIERGRDHGGATTRRDVACAIERRDAARRATVARRRPCPPPPNSS